MTSLWLEYVLRFSHLVAGIAWIGSSFYFIWLDSAFVAPEIPRRNVEGEVFMVHGGFYYQVEKRKFYPGELPKVLHWFKWEATLTWFTGFLLLIYLYFLRGASLLIDPGVLNLTQLQAVGLSLLIVAGSWLLYDTIWHPKFMKYKRISTVLSLLFMIVLIVGLTRIFSGRGAFILTGATFGTAMLLNVWVRILPGQAKMIKEAQAGQIPDYSVSLKSKARSVHNTYFIFPVLFIMLSNHYPEVYNHPQNWLLLILLSVSGALTRHAMVTKNPKERWTLAPAAIVLVALVYFSAIPQLAVVQPVGMAVAKVQYSEIKSVVQNRCLTCHSSQPSDDFYKVAPKGAIFETEEQLRAHAAKIHMNVILAKIMPLGNKTHMTDEERALVGRWLKEQGLAP